MPASPHFAPLQKTRLVTHYQRSPIYMKVNTSFGTLNERLQA